MWPFERRASSEFLRVGRDAVERWALADGCLSMVAEQRIAEADKGRLPSLVEAMHALYSPHSGDKTAMSIRRSRACGITMLVESAWLPVTLVDTGPSLLRSAQIEALVRHRFALHYSDELEPVSGWDLRIKHRAGDRHAIAYAIAPRVERTFVDSARALGMRLDAILSASAWGFDRLLRGKVRMPSRGWWLWPEQDRTLVARIGSNRIVGLNAGAPRMIDPTMAPNLVCIEAARSGIQVPDEPVLAATWSDFTADMTMTAPRVTWTSVLGHAAERPMRKSKALKVSA